MTRSTNRKGKLRDKPKRRGPDRPAVKVQLNDTPIINPKRWVERRIELVARSVVQPGTYLDLATLAQRIAKATYSFISMAEWGVVELNTIRGFHGQQRLSELIQQRVVLRDGAVTVQEVFIIELDKLSADKRLGDLCLEVYCILCWRALDWALIHPVSPSGYKEKEERKPT